MAEDRGSAPSGQQLNRACEACRSLKVRCISDPRGSPSCQRCLKFKRQCIFAYGRPRRHPRPAGGRVAELEKEFYAMRALLLRLDHPRDQQQTKVYRNQKSISQQVRVRSTSNIHPLGDDMRKHPQLERQKTSAEHTTANDDIHRTADVIELGLLTIQDAQQLLETFNQRMSMNFPIIQIEGLSAQDLRTSKPTLLLAVMAAAAAQARPDLYSALSTAIVKEYAIRVTFRGEKSTEIIQSLLLTAVWYLPVGSYERSRSYEFVRMASTMAVDLGLDGTSPDSIQGQFAAQWTGLRTGGALSADANLDAIEDDLARRRAILGCYISSVSLATSLRRPNMLQLNPYMLDCVRVLVSRPDTTPTNTMMAAWTRLMNISNEISAGLHRTDPERLLEWHDPRSQQLILSCAERLDRWYDLHSTGPINDGLLMVYHNIRTHLHETALYKYYAPATFGAPFLLDVPAFDAIALGVDTTSLSSLISSAQSFLITHNGATLDQLRAHPNHFFVRATYSLLVLVRVALLDCYAIDFASDISLTEIACTDHFLEVTISKLLAAAGIMEYRVPWLFATGAIRLRKWYRYQLSVASSADPSRAPNSPVPLLANSDNHPAFQDPDGSPEVIDLLEFDDLAYNNHKHSELSESSTTTTVSPSAEMPSLSINPLSESQFLAMSRDLTEFSNSLSSENLERSILDFDNNSMGDFGHLLLGASI